MATKKTRLKINHEANFSHYADNKWLNRLVQAIAGLLPDHWVMYNIKKSPDTSQTKTAKKEKKPR